MDFKKLFEQINFYAFRLTFYSVDFQEQLAGFIKKKYPDALMSVHIPTEYDNGLIDMDAVVESLDTSIESVVTKPIYDFQILDSENDMVNIHIYLSPYFLFISKNVEAGEASVCDVFYDVFSELNKMKELLTPSSFACILNMHQEISEEQIKEKFVADAFPCLNRSNLQRGRYVDTYGKDDTIIDVVRIIKSTNGGLYDVNIVLNENLYFESFNQLDITTAIDEMVLSASNDFYKCIKG